MFDFPNTPAVSDTVTLSSGMVYSWDGTKWGLVPTWLPLAGGMLTGPLQLAADPTSALQAATKAYVDSRVVASAGVSTFNTRFGDVVLTASDVNTALGYTAYDAANPAGYLTTSALAPYSTTADGDTRWVNLTGDTMTGQLVVDGGVVTPSSFYLTSGAYFYSDSGYTYLFQDTANWRWQYQRSTGAMQYVRGSDSAALFTIDGGGNISCAGTAYVPSTLTVGGELQCNNSIMNATGTFFVANNTNYYMQRNGSNGIWYWVEGGTINMSLDPSGNLGARAGISGTTLQVTNVLGINYSGIGGYWIAFGWNGSLNLYVNGGYQYDVASTQWINGNFYPAGTTDGRYLYKSGDTCTGTLLAHGGVYTIDGSHGMFVSGADRYVQFQSNWYFHYVNSTGNLLWYNPFGVSMVFSYGDSRIYNNQGPMGGVGAYQNLSDERLKRDITPAAYGLAEILRLEPIRFTRLPRSTKDRAERHPEIGLSAQQVQAVLPEAVTAVDLADDEGGKETSLAIGYDALTAALINAVKELSARVVALEAR